MSEILTNFAFSKCRTHTHTHLSGFTGAKVLHLPLAVFLQWWSHCGRTVWPHAAASWPQKTLLKQETLINWPQLQHSIWQKSSSAVISAPVYTRSQKTTHHPLIMRRWRTQRLPVKHLPQDQLCEISTNICLILHKLHHVRCRCVILSASRIAESHALLKYIFLKIIYRKNHLESTQQPLTPNYIYYIIYI